MIATKTNPQEAAEMREDWTRAVNNLAWQITEWAEGLGWTVTRADQEMREETLGTYSAPVLTIDTPADRFPRRDGAGEASASCPQGLRDSKGRVDLRAWPSFFRVMLLRQPDDTWVVHTDSGIDWPAPWSRETSVDLVRRLIRA